MNTRFHAVLNDMIESDSLTEDAEIITELLDKKKVSTLEKTIDKIFKKLQSDGSFKKLMKELNDTCNSSLVRPEVEVDYRKKSENTTIDIDNSTAYGYKSKIISVMYWNGDYPSFSIDIDCGINRPREDNTTIVKIVNSFTKRHNPLFDNKDIPKIEKIVNKILQAMDKVTETELKASHLEYDKQRSSALFAKYYIN